MQTAPSTPVLIGNWAAMCVPRLVCKATQGLYYVPQKMPFDQAPFDEAAPVAKFQSSFYSVAVDAMFKALGIEGAN